MRPLLLTCLLFSSWSQVSDAASTAASPLLRLSATQRTQMATILKDSRSQAERLREQTQDRLKGVLTPEQLRLWESRHPVMNVVAEPPNPR